MAEDSQNTPDIEAGIHGAQDSVQAIIDQAAGITASLEAASEKLDAAGKAVDGTDVALDSMKAVVLEVTGLAAPVVTPPVVPAVVPVVAATPAVAEAPTPTPVADAIAAAAAEAAGEPLFLQVVTPLDAAELQLEHIHGEESVSDLFRYILQMRSLDAALDFSQIVGKKVTVSIAMQDGTKRYINGYVARFSHVGSNREYVSYYAEVVPWLWILTLTKDSRIFQNKTTVEIITSLFDELEFTDYRNSLTKSYAAREYCVQYQESVFEFVSRLMEDEGIFYFFDHEDGKHTLVLADDTSAHTDCPGLTKAKMRKSHMNDREETEVVDCSLEQNVLVGKFALDDFSFETPSTDLMVSVDGGEGTMRMYEYPGGFMKTADGEARAGLRIAEHEVPRQVLTGSSYCKAFIAGFKFELSGHERSAANAKYILHHVALSAKPDGDYTNSFRALPDSTEFRPPRKTRKPVIVSTQTAMVVGKSGEEIWTDQYGRVKVQFHWDQKGKNDENSSCWIRVSYGWTGKNWGAIFIPRIGMEVIVSFLDGDPDRPIITGMVYNAQQTVPYALPDEQTKSTIKTNTSKGGNGSNEVRFEDKKDSEEIYVHAQKDNNIVIVNDRTKEVGHDEKVTIKNDRTKNVQHDETNTIKNNRTTTIQEGNESLTVEKGNRTVKVNTGTETHEVKGTRSVTVTGDETHINKANFTQTVDGDYQLTVKGAFTLTVTGDITIKSDGAVTVQAGTEIKNTAGTTLTNKAGTALTNEAGTGLTNKSGTDMTNEAGTSMTNKASLSMTNDGGVSLTNKASATQTVDGGGMLTVKGGLVKIN